LEPFDKLRERPQTATLHLADTALKYYSHINSTECLYKQAERENPIRWTWSG